MRYWWIAFGGTMINEEQTEVTFNSENAMKAIEFFTRNVWLRRLA